MCMHAHIYLHRYVHIYRESIQTTWTISTKVSTYKYIYIHMYMYIDIYYMPEFNWVSPVVRCSWNGTVGYPRRCVQSGHLISTSTHSPASFGGSTALFWGCPSLCVFSPGSLQNRRLRPSNSPRQVVVTLVGTMLNFKAVVLDAIGTSQVQVAASFPRFINCCCPMA